MRRTDDRTLVNQGRKAGLRTEEMYNALSNRPAVAATQAPGLTDGNGFVATIAENGNRLYAPPPDREAP